MRIDQKELAAMLVYISDWCIKHQLGTGIIHNTPEEGITDGIFVNGNYARVLTCTYELTGEQTYLNEAVSWCDYFVNSANSVKTSLGNDALWWWDIDNKNLYLADTGTAIHALFKVFPYVNVKRQQKYLDAFKKFYRLIAEGTDRDPLERGQAPSPGWIINEGSDAGAFGVGYYNGQLELRSYSVSTATAGAQACSALFKLTNDPTYRKTAIDAALWLLKQFNEQGNIPYRIQGQVREKYIFEGLHYSLEGLLTAWLYLNDEEFNNRLKMIAPKTLEFVLSLQNESGYWGTEREYDSQRSAFLAHFLHWYYQNVEPDLRAESGAEKFATYVLDPENTARYGIPNLVRVTGFVGLVFASFLYPELDIGHPTDPVPLYDYRVDELRSIAQKWSEG